MPVLAEPGGLWNLSITIARWAGMRPELKEFR